MNVKIRLREERHSKDFTWHSYYYYFILFLIVYSPKCFCFVLL